MYVKAPQVKLAQLWYWPCSFFWSFYYISKTEIQGIAPKYWNHKWTKSNREGVIINMTASQAMYKKQGEILQNYRLIPPFLRDPILMTPPGSLHMVLFRLDVLSIKIPATASRISGTILGCNFHSMMSSTAWGKKPHNLHRQERRSHDSRWEDFVKIFRELFFKKLWYW